MFPCWYRLLFIYRYSFVKSFLSFFLKVSKYQVNWEEPSRIWLTAVGNQMAFRLIQQWQLLWAEHINVWGGFNNSPPPPPPLNLYELEIGPYICNCWGFPLLLELCGSSGGTMKCAKMCCLQMGLPAWDFWIPSFGTRHYSRPAFLADCRGFHNPLLARRDKHKMAAASMTESCCCRPFVPNKGFFVTGRGGGGREAIFQWSKTFACLRQNSCFIFFLNWLLEIVNWALPERDIDLMGLLAWCLSACAVPSVSVSSSSHSPDIV